MHSTVIPQHFTIEQTPEAEEELRDRNAYLLGLGITGIWFEKGQFEYIEAMLRLARHELRYRGVFPGGAKKAAEAVIDNPIQERGLMGKIWNRLFGQRWSGFDVEVNANRMAVHETAKLPRLVLDIFDKEQRV